jgi:hypothetical protein
MASGSQTRPNPRSGLPDARVRANELLAQVGTDARQKLGHAVVLPLRIAHGHLATRNVDVLDASPGPATPPTGPFPAGSCVVLYRDGITEVENIHDEAFGNERLEALLEQHIDYSASLIRDQIADAVYSFVGEAPQKDDETLVIVRRA